MLSILKGMLITLRTSLRKPVTAQYPKQHLPLMDRQVGFPALTWDAHVGEPYCVGCMVCVRLCPTQCMSGTMMDNPLHAEGKSPRRKMIEEFEINLGRCILCGICVEVCNFDAIEMSHEHEISHYARDGRRSDLPVLLEMGKKYQAESNWIPPAARKAALAAEKAAVSAPAGEGTKAVTAPAGEETKAVTAPAGEGTKADVSAAAEETKVETESGPSGPQASPQHAPAAEETKEPPEEKAK
ncbi:MAG: NADH-quinone oxidoreductase subunit I [Chloroflexi bacterium]|nr:NADH-quinone oxidoreductase subunit I [Chloroflexota bacterium]